MPIIEKKKSSSDLRWFKSSSMDETDGNRRMSQHEMILSSLKCFGLLCSSISIYCWRRQMHTGQNRFVGKSFFLT